MRPRLACLILIGCPSLALRAQEDPFETRVYAVDFLTMKVTDRPGVRFGLEPERGSGWDRDGEHRLLSSETLTNLIRANIAEDSWAHSQAHLGYDGGTLIITNRASIQAKIEQYLAFLRSQMGKLITIDALILSVDPEFLAKLRAQSPPDRPAAIGPDQMKALMDAIREGKQAELVRSSRVTAHPGQRVHLQEATARGYLRSHDVRLAASSAALVPLMDSFFTGSGFDVRAYLEPFKNAVTMELRADTSELEELETRKVRLGKEGPGTDGRAPGLSVEAVIQLPRIARTALRTTVTVQSGETLVLGTLLRRGRMLAFLATPSILTLEARPAPEPAFDEQRLLRIYDVSPLTRSVVDFAAPEQGSPGSEAPYSRMSAVSLVDLIRTHVAPESWGNKRNTISAEERRLLVIRQKPEVLREIDRYLGGILTSNAQMVTVQAVVLGFRKGARLDWEKEVPGLSGGGYFVEAEKFERLASEGTRDRRIRWLEAAEITGFPLARVYAAALREENILGDVQPQVGPGAALFGPVVRTLRTGFTLDALPRLTAGGERTEVDLRSWRTSRELRELEAASSGSGPLQASLIEGPRWVADVVCAKGRWTLVALETRGPVEEPEELGLFLRARTNLLK